MEMRSMGKGVESIGRGNMEKGGMNIEVAGMGKGGIWGGGTWDGGWVVGEMGKMWIVNKGIGEMGWKHM